MKFDCIIMNPPYQRNLHLKILANTITYLKDENSKCINLSPINWLQHKLAKYKKNNDYNRFKNSISEHIEDLEVITAKKANELFNINNFTDLGLYTCSIKGRFDYNEFNRNELKYLDSIFNKIINYLTMSDKNKFKKYITNDISGYCTMVYAIAGQKGQHDKKSFYDLAVQKDIYYNGININNGKSYADNCGGIKKANAKKLNKEIVLDHVVSFQTKNECKNFIDSCYTNFIWLCGLLTKNDMNPQFDFIPYMHDYTEPWTDERFYKFFDITEEEQKIIEETIAKYK